MTEDKQQEIQAQEYDASQIQVLEGLEAVSYTHLTLPTIA